MITRQKNFMAKLMMRIIVFSTIILFAACPPAPTPAPTPGGGNGGTTNQAPRITNSSFIFNVVETDTNIGTVTVTDPDTGDTFTFTIKAAVTQSNANIDIFSIAGSTGAITVSAGTLKVADAPYRVTVTVTDGKIATPIEATFTVNVRATTTMNTPPVVSNQTFNNVPVGGSAVGTVSASDPDSGDTLAYSIASATETGGIATTIFNINAGTGAITVTAGALDATKDPYTINVSVTDGTTPSTAVMTVNINSPPMVTTTGLSASTMLSVGGMFGTIASTDPDGDTITYTLVSATEGNGTNAGTTTTNIFAVAENGAVSLASGTIEAAKKPYTLNIQASDPYNPAVSASIAVDVVTTNQSPTLADQTIHVAENQAVSVNFGTITASDPEGATLTWAIVDNAVQGSDPIFDIQSTGGSTAALRLQTGRSLNYSGAPATHTIRISATDDATPSANTVMADITVDVNRTPAITASQTFTIAENATGNVSSAVVATDADSDTLSYAIVSTTPPSLPFTISETGGQLRLTSPLDFEDLQTASTNPITVNVRVTDDGEGTLSATGDVSVMVTNVNEAPSISAQTRSVNENTSGDFGDPIMASDPDGTVDVQPGAGTANDQLTYSITDNVMKDGTALFGISSTGKISLATALDYETDTTYRTNTITVQVSDGALTDTATITINLVDLAEGGSPTIDTTSFDVNVFTTTFPAVVATDPDGDTLTYAITAQTKTDGTATTVFSIDSSSGVISVAEGALSIAEQPYSVTVSVNDGTNPAVPKAIPVNVGTGINIGSITTDKIPANNATVPEMQTLDASEITGPSGITGVTLSYAWAEVSASTAPNVYPPVITPKGTPSGVMTDILVYAERDISAQRTFTLTVTASKGSVSVSETITRVYNIVVEDIDLDNDGLIEIRGLTMLHNMRYNRFGTGYRPDNPSTALTGMNKNDELRGFADGCPDTGCFGYELVGDLTFDTDGQNDGTWDKTSRNAQGVYTLDMGDNNDVYFNVAAGGWLPIPSVVTGKFNATFNGNGYTITGLAVQRDAPGGENGLGLFSSLGAGSVVSNLGLVDNLSNNTGADAAHIGGLVGFAKGAKIVATYVTGGHVSSSEGSPFTWATEDGVEITSDGTSTYPGAPDYIGGLIGLANSSIIVGAFSNSNVYAGGGADVNVGGLIGRIENTTYLRSSYAKGALDGGTSVPNGGSARGTNRHQDAVSGLATIGSSSTISNSYSIATFVNAETSRGIDAGLNTAPNIVRASYAITTGGFAQGTASGKDTTIITARSGWTPGTSTVNSLTLAIANNPNDETGNPHDNLWDSNTELSKGAWNFGTSSEAPALNFADYDGTRASFTAGTDIEILFHCANDTTSTPPTGAILIANCGTLIPNQR